MRAQKSLFVLAALMFTSLLSVSGAKAAPQCYTLASLQGAYTIIGHYGPSVAIAFNRTQLDGKGNLTSTFVVNEPTPGSTTGARTVVTGSQTGTYTVNGDGTGVISRFVQTSTGVNTTVVSDFVITRARQTEDGVLIATELVDAQRTPSAIVAGGIFLTRSYTRLPGLTDATE